MSRKCLYCYQPLNEKEHGDYHERCSLKFFGNKTPPEFSYTMNQIGVIRSYSAWRTMNFRLRSTLISLIFRFVAFSRLPPLAFLFSMSQFFRCTFLPMASSSESSPSILILQIIGAFPLASALDLRCQNSNVNF